MFKRGDVVEILKEYQDVGDDAFTWVVLNDEEKGRVDVRPVDINLTIKPIYTVTSDQIKLAASGPQSKPALSVTVEQLASEFSKALSTQLTPAQMREVIARNAQEMDPHICHSHDFCDANVVMHEVFLAHDMDPAEEGGAEKWGNLWDKVWNLAKGSSFQFS